MNYFERICMGIQNCWNDIPIGGMSSPEQWVKACEDQGAEYATGVSDASSVRDQDSGPGKVRWTKGDPYRFRREQCMNHEGKLRRLKPTSNVDGDLFWDYEFPSDDEGWTKQPSFVTSSYIATNQYGERETEVERTERQRHERLGDIVDESWKEMSGGGQSTDLKMIKDLRLIRYVAPEENMTVDSKMLEEKFVSLV